ncbi:MAG: RluA family pseudouridine synthase [Candidatus Paceibacterota bacterium]
MKKSSLNPEILFEDQDLLVINKPGGVVVNSAVSVTGETLQDWFADRQKTQDLPADWSKQLPEDFSDEYGTPEEIYAQRQGMVHRLDKDTSGVMVFAKHPGSLISLLTQFKQRMVQKEYVALVHGQFRVEQGTLNSPLGRSRTDRQKFTITVTGRPAVTQYRVKQTFSGFDWPNLENRLGERAAELKKNKRFYEQGFSLVSCLPKTGRTHQIRVHLAHEQHPLVGDIKYIGRKRARLDPLWCPRQFLHAATLELTHPRTNKRARFEAKLAPELSSVLDFLS